MKRIVMVISQLGFHDLFQSFNNKTVFFAEIDSIDLQL